MITRECDRTDGKFADQVPDPEVVPKAKRRKYSAEYKLRILQEYEACTDPGKRGELEGLAPKKRRRDLVERN